MADFVWNETLGEQIRSQTQRAMEGQADEIRRTIANFDRQAEQHTQAARRLRQDADRLAASPTIMKSVSRYDSDGNYMYSDTVEDTAAMAARAREVAEMRRQADEMLRQAAEVRRAATELKNAAAQLERYIESTNRLFEEMRQLAQKTDAESAARMRQINDKIQQYTRRMLDIKNSFNAGGSDMAQNLEKVALAASIANVLTLNPSSANAVDRLLETAKNILNMAAFMEPKRAGLDILCALGLDPVNLATGNFVYSKEDITVPGRYPLTFKRFYNAMGSFDGVLGHGWTHNYNIRLFQAEDAVHIVFDDGRVETYTRVAENFYVAPLEHKNTLIVPEEGGYAFELLMQSTIRYRFDENGSLRCMDDINGIETLLDYDETGILLEKVTSPSVWMPLTMCFETIDWQI